MPAVDVADERRMNAVAQQLLQPRVERAHDVARHGKDVVLLLTQPARGVLQQHAQPRPLGVVGTAAMPERAEDEQDRAGGHRHRHRLVRVDRHAVGPSVAAGYDPGRAVVDGEVVERPHRVQYDVLMRPGQGVDAVIGVQPLRLLARSDLDAGGRAELVALAEHAVEHAEQQRMCRQPVEGTGLGEQRVDAAGAEALEVVAPGGRPVEDRTQAGADRGGLLGRQQSLDHRVAVAVEVGQHPGEQGVVERVGRHAADGTSTESRSEVRDNGRVPGPDLLPSREAREAREARPPTTAGRFERVQRHRGFVLLWAGATCSRFATEMHSVAVVLFVLAQTGSAHLAGLTVAAATFPTVVTGPVVGAWLDRTPHRRTAFLSSPIVLVVAMAGFLAAGDTAPGRLFVALGFVAGLPSPVRTGGFSGLIPTVVPEAVLPRAYGLEAASYNIAGIAGPATAGAVAGAFSAGWAIAGTMVVAVAAVAVIAQVPIEPGVPTAGRPLKRMLTDGLALLWRDRSLRAVSVATTISQGAFGLVVVAYPLLADELHHKRAVGGLLFSVFAVGALVGSLVYSKLASRLRNEPVIYVMLVLFGLCLAAVGAAPSLRLALVASAVAGVVDGPLLAATLNLRQRVAPEHLRTQVFTTAASLKIGAFAIGSAFAGFAADSLGVRGMLVLAGAGQVVSAAAGLTTRKL